MAGPITIDDGGLALKDPADTSVYEFDWDTYHLGAGVAITSSTFTLTALSPTAAALPTKDQESIVTGARKTRLRIAGGDLGAVYQVDNRIVTDEVPTQTKERSFKLKVENR